MLQSRGRRRLSISAEQPEGSVNMSIEVDGNVLELVHVVPKSGSSQIPPLLLVHGVFHGAWFWERFQVLSRLRRMRRTPSRCNEMFAALISP